MIPSKNNEIMEAIKNVADQIIDIDARVGDESIISRTFLEFDTTIKDKFDRELRKEGSIPRQAIIETLKFACNQYSQAILTGHLGQKFLIGLDQSPKFDSSPQLLQSSNKLAEALKEFLSSTREDEAKPLATPSLPFENRELVLQKLKPSDVSDVIVGIEAPSGYGKTHLLNHLKYDENYRGWAFFYIHCSDEQLAHAHRLAENSEVTDIELLPKLVRTPIFDSMKLARQLYRGFRDEVSLYKGFETRYKLFAEESRSTPHNLARAMYSDLKSLIGDSHNGIVIVLDDFDVLFSDEKNKTVALEIAETYCSELVRFFEQENPIEITAKTFRIILAGRELRKCIPNEIGKPITLDLFTFATIRNAIKRRLQELRKQHDSDDNISLERSRDNVNEFAEKILHYTGGHPELISMIIPHFVFTEERILAGANSQGVEISMKISRSREKNDDIEVDGDNTLRQHLITVMDEIVEGLPEILQYKDNWKKLCIFQRIWLPQLNWMLDGYNNESVENLEYDSQIYMPPELLPIKNRPTTGRQFRRQLRKSGLYSLDTSNKCLQDAVTRNVLLARRRYEEDGGISAMKDCEYAYQSCIALLDKKCFDREIGIYKFIVSEAIYQKIQAISFVPAEEQSQHIQEFYGEESSEGELYNVLQKYLNIIQAKKHEGYVDDLFDDITAMIKEFDADSFRLLERMYLHSGQAQSEIPLIRDRFRTLAIEKKLVKKDDLEDEGF